MWTERPNNENMTGEKCYALGWNIFFSSIIANQSIAQNLINSYVDTILLNQNVNKSPFLNAKQVQQNPVLALRIINICVHYTHLYLCTLIINFEINLEHMYWFCCQQT
uniref:Uncharacterized protein n=1 Tax=Glossina austeni TaxID=7395 RepID=A0A1A9VPE4_GLOAU